MNWLKQNWFKAAIVVVASAFGLYYFSVVMPARDLETKIAQCRNLGEEYRKNEIAENPTISFLVPKYAYNKKLNTCLYSGAFVVSVGSEGYSIDKYIIDLNTNRKIESSIYINDRFFGGITTEEFNRRESEFFGSE